MTATTINMAFGLLGQPAARAETTATTNITALLLAGAFIWGFPQIRGTILGVPIIRAIV